MTAASVKRVSTAGPKIDRHNASIVFAEQMLVDLRPRAWLGLLCLGRWM
jgi:hypothetical protein